MAETMSNENDNDNDSDSDNNGENDYYSERTFSFKWIRRPEIILAFLLRAPIDNRQLFASEGATLGGIN